jgi:putative SOS response-associated peptidase YedK
MRLDTDWSEVVRSFDLDPDDLLDFTPRWNVAPTQLVPIVTWADGRRRACWASWGFAPWWERSAKPKRRPINARAETIATSGMFRQAFRDRRCVVPATGFYEWESLADGKQPWLFSRADGAMLALAGLWSRWEPAGGAAAYTFCVLTTAANAVAARLHDRMPVILSDARAIELWLDAEADAAALTALLRPAHDALLDARPVSRAMNVPAADDPESCALLG